MTLEVIDSDGQKVLNPQGVETETGLSFPEAVRETTNHGQVLWLNSAPTKKAEVTSSQESLSPKA